MYSSLFTRQERYRRCYPTVHPHDRWKQEEFKKALLKTLGIYRTYLYYCYLLGRLPEKIPNRRPPHPAMREDLRLDYRTWGKRMCLFCYFTDEDTGEKIRLACWRNAKEHYAPRKCTTIDFARVPMDSLWSCTLEADTRGNINWVMAEKID